MKIILTKDVRDMGRAGSVHEVSDGHALNYLIPNKMAVLATAQAIKNAETRKQHADEQKALDVELIKQRLTDLAETPVTVSRKANEKGHLYDAVGANDLAEVAQLPEEVIKLEKPIKELGEFEVPVAFGDQFGSFKLLVEAE